MHIHVTVPDGGKPKTFTMNESLLGTPGRFPQAIRLLMELRRPLNLQEFATLVGVQYVAWVPKREEGSVP